MSHFVIGYDAALFFAHDAVFLFFTDQDYLYGFEEVFLGYGLATVFDCQDGRLVDHIRQIGSYGSAGGQGDGVQIDGFIHFHILGMNLQDIDTSLQVRSVYDDTAVEAARTQKRGVKDFGAVGRSQYQAGRVTVEAVHFRKKLVQGLLTLVVSSAQAAITTFSDGVDLINEDDAGGMLLGFLEQIADTGCSHADEHFYEIGSGQREERYMRFSCHGLGKQGFSGSRRAYQQGSFGELSSDLGVFSGIVQEVYNLL